MKVLTRKALEALLAARVEEWELIAPVEIDGKSYFHALNSGSRLGEVTDASAAPLLTVNPVKEFFFPRRQELYVQGPEGITSLDSEPQRPRLLLFARPCDARGLGVLDRVFLGEVPDASYAARREATTIVGLHCLEPDSRCFCSAVGGGPFGTEGMDMALTPLDESRFAAEALTEKGEALLAALGAAAGKAGGAPGLPDAGEAERRLVESLRAKAEAAVSRDLEIPSPEALAARFESDYWIEASRSCLACGVCSYLCPTCHCFDIVDEGYLRLRCWDTCSADTFTRTAAGENHHKHKHTRYRQRVFHKFGWFKENYGTVSCVGCGRCTRHCPVKIDIAEVVNGVGASHG